MTVKKSFLSSNSLFFIVITSMMMVIPSTAGAADLPPFPFITVTGEAQMEVAPDKAEVNFTLLVFNKDAAAGLDDMMQRSQQVIDLGKKYSIPQQDILSLGLRKELKRRSESHQQLEILGYDISQNYRISLNDISHYPDFMSELIALNNLVGVRVQFDVSDRAKLQRTLVEKASKDAKTRGNDLAKAMGVSIHSVYALGEEQVMSAMLSSFDRSAFDRRFKEGGVSGGSVNSMNLFVPNSITLSKQVKTIFRIKP